MTTRNGGRGGPRASEEKALVPSTVEAPVRLTREQKAVLEEAMEHARQAVDEMEDQVVTLGRFLLQHVFDGDTAAALDLKHASNPVWRELLRRAGGPTMRASTRLLHVALRLAAWDHRLNDETWRLLDVGRKELLLPLGEPALLRKAAQHVTSMKLTQDATRRFVQATLERQKGQEPRVRVNAAQLAKNLRGLRERYGTAALRQGVARLPDDKREALRREVEETLATLAKLREALKR